MTELLTVAVDGSALGNPGPAGWCWYISDEHWAAGGWDEATNNQGELQAVIELLATTANLDTDLHIVADSQYVINSITQWMPGWKKRGWKKKDGKPVQNQQMMIHLDQLMAQAQQAGRKIRFDWLRGHTGHELNEAADQRARAVAEAFRDGTVPDYGPGLNSAGRSSHLTASESVAQPASADRLPSGTTTTQPRPGVQVTTELSHDESETIIARARQAQRSPQQELARLIRLAMNHDYQSPPGH
ncbi:ribonuclease HI [Auritidibacter ignavus]|uniref:RNase H family protein n=1 Tax=Auritidibacter ignavus TaxID=678932 RepID=UPI00244CF0B5|nr:RNase H family protein [Auritidibacter ignavus]WGH91287.1 ribonuclease HI [Auritidibacter ignavus]